MGFGAIFFTVDATWSGKREADIRAKGADGFAVYTAFTAVFG
jgi:hypothetical protein